MFKTKIEAMEYIKLYELNAIAIPRYSEESNEIMGWEIMDI